MSKSLQLSHAEVGPWPMNAYALVCPESRESILVDPGADPERLMGMLAGTSPQAIVLTHSHADHVGALDEVRRRIGGGKPVPVLAFAAERSSDVGPVDPLEDGGVIRIGHHKVRAQHAPGHCPDLVCLRVEDDNRVLVGDAVFDGGPGRTWSAEGFRATLATLRRVVLEWPDDTQCYPGHGPSFKLGDRRAAIEAFVARDHGGFFGDATW